MAISIYTVNREIGRPIEFKGLKGNYVGALGLGVVVQLLGFVAFYLLGLSMPVCILGLAATASAFSVLLYRLNRRYSGSDLLKHIARRRVPSAIRFTDRSMYMGRKGQDNG